MSNVIVLRNARLLDGTGVDPRENATVVAEDERIVDVRDAVVFRSPPGATAIDCRGHTLMPGLTDAHVHVLGAEANVVEMHRNLAPSLVALQAGTVLEAMLRRGFTTVRDCGGADWGIREAVARGVVDGPRLLISGRPLSQTGGHADFRRMTELGPPLESCVSFLGSVADGPDQVRRAVREELRRGADQIKVMASGGPMAASPSDRLEACQFSVLELRAATEEAAEAGTYVSAHAYTAASVQRALAGGVRCIEHGPFIDEAAAEAIKRAGAFLVPTMTPSTVWVREGERYGAPVDLVQKMAYVREHVFESVALARRVGITMGSGSDVVGPMLAHQTLELVLKAEVLSPMEAIVSATRTNAELFRMADRIGTIEPGKLADLLVVRGDPVKDIRLLLTPEENLLMIMKGGAVKRCLLA